MRAHLLVAVAATVLVGGASAATADDGGIIRVVTLGDSYASGMGIHPDPADYDDHGPAAHSFGASTHLGSSACHRETDTTAGAQVAVRLGARSIVAACAGAAVADVERQLATVDVVGTGGETLFALTIGGNDLRTVDGSDWPDVLIDCITAFGCDDAAGNQLANIDDVEHDLVELYTAIVTA
jgi:hypothetical protein